MDWLQFAVQWIHVVLGILWFGYSLAMYVLVWPALARLPETQQRAALPVIGHAGSRIFPSVGGIVLLLGVVRGTLFGPINELGDLGTAYGITWLVALVLTAALLTIGARNLAPGFAGLADAADYPSAAARLRRLAGYELVLFLIVFTCMVLMRFGY